MKDKEKIRQAFSNVYVSKQLEEKIFSLTVEKKTKKHLKFKVSYAVILIFVMCVVSLPIVYATEFKEIIKRWSSSVKLEDDTEIKVSESNGYKEIPKDAAKTRKYERGIEMTYQQVEEMLGFKILKIKEGSFEPELKGEKDEPIIYYTTGLNDDESIGRVDLWIAPFVGKSEEKNISLSVSMLNVGADSGYISAFQGDSDATAGKVSGDTYHLNRLDVDVVIYGSDWDSKRLTAVFVYKDIKYLFIGNQYSKDEMMEVLDSLVE